MKSRNGRGGLRVENAVAKISVVCFMIAKVVAIFKCRRDYLCAFNLSKENPIFPFIALFYLWPHGNEHSMRDAAAIL